MQCEETAHAVNFYIVEIAFIAAFFQRLKTDDDGEEMGEPKINRQQQAS